MADFTVISPTTALTLDIRSGGDYSELYLEGQPLALTWSINDGSVWDYLIRFSYPDAFARLKRFRDALLGCSDETTILDIIMPTLAAGSYRTLLTDFYGVVACLPECSLDIAHPTDFYGGDYTLVTTLPDTELSEDRVYHYELMIRDGLRPLAVALCCYDHSLQQPTTAFLIDGHHKVAAYQRCGVRNHVFMIARCDSPAPTQAYPSLFATSRLLRYYTCKTTNGEPQR